MDKAAQDNLESKEPLLGDARIEEGFKADLITQLQSDAPAPVAVQVALAEAQARHEYQILKLLESQRSEIPWDWLLFGEVTLAPFDTLSETTCTKLVARILYAWVTDASLHPLPVSWALTSLLLGIHTGMSHQ